MATPTWEARIRVTLTCPSSHHIHPDVYGPGTAAILWATGPASLCGYRTQETRRTPTHHTHRLKAPEFRDDGSDTRCRHGGALILCQVIRRSERPPAPQYPAALCAPPLIHFTTGVQVLDDARRGRLQQPSQGQRQDGAGGTPRWCQPWGTDA